MSKELKERGYGSVLLRIDNRNSYKFEGCDVRAEQENDFAKSQTVDLYAEIHINAGGGSGTEVLITNIAESPKAEKYAAKVSLSVSGALGIPNRGVKKQNLIVLNRTIMPTILVECLFADSSDSKKYNAEVVAKNIEMIAYFKSDGMINPIKFRIEEDDRMEVIRIKKIISTDTEKLCGNKMMVFTCSAFINNMEKIFEIKYDVEKCRWMLFKI